MRAFMACAWAPLVAATPIQYGPSGCVSLSLSAAGSCVIQTKCGDHNLDDFEFAFDCTTPKHEKQRHSFGLGGFDPEEAFDTEVKCLTCSPPGAPNDVKAPAAKLAPHNFALEAARKSGANTVAVSAAATAKVRTDTAVEVVKYGPEKCVSTYKSPEGHCMMQTACSGLKNSTELANYEFGLICVDKGGVPVRHLFGKNSFDPDETFDTLIMCEQCLGLEDIADDVALTGQVIALSKEIKSLKTMMTNITADVQKLNDKVFSGAAAAAPAANETEASLTQHTVARAVQTTQGAQEAHQEVAVAHHAQHALAHHKKSLRHGRKHHHRHHYVRRDEDEETEVEQPPQDDVDADTDEQTDVDVQDPAPRRHRKHHHHHRHHRQAPVTTVSVAAEDTGASDNGAEDDARAESDENEEEEEEEAEQ